MDSVQIISKKIALIGSFGVGKTSLISRFVEGKFPEKYISTIGLKVDKKTIRMEQGQLDLLIWDIAGQQNLAQVPQYYLNGCKGLIYVTDLSRPATYQDLKTQLELLRNLIPSSDLVVVANKKDLYNELQLLQILKEYPAAPDLLTSALTGENVEEMFVLLAQKMMHSHESKGA